MKRQSEYAVKICSKSCMGETTNLGVSSDPSGFYDIVEFVSPSLLVFVTFLILNIHFHFSLLKNSFYWCIADLQLNFYF